MKRSLRIALIVLVFLVLSGIAIGVAAQLLYGRKSERIVAVAVPSLALHDDALNLARGKYLFNAIGCIECHGSDGAGRVFINDPNGLFVQAPNITRGANGVVANYQVTDWVRIIRHGVKPQGTPAFIMPSEDYNRLTDADLAALIVYARSLPSAAGAPATIRTPFLIKALYAFGVIRDAAEKIDHHAFPAPAVASGPSVAHGAYMANGCIGCHGAGFAGGKIPGAPPSWPAAANLTPAPGSALRRYANAAQFKTMFRTGKRPDGSAVSTVMPFNSLRNYDDTDLEAIYVFLQSLPAVASQK